MDRVDQFIALIFKCIKYKKKKLGKIKKFIMYTLTILLNV